MVSLVPRVPRSAALGKWWGGAFAGWEVLLQVVNALVGFALTTVVFAMIYKLMPRVHGEVARRLARRARSRLDPVHDRQVPDRPVHRQKRAGVGLRRRWLADRRLSLGLLLGADLSARCGVHLGLRQDAPDRCAARRASPRKVAQKAHGHRRGARAQGARRSAGGRRRAPCRFVAAIAPLRREPRSGPERGAAMATLGDLGAGVAFLFALRFLIPRLLRRL